MYSLIAIHESPGGFSDRWIECCNTHSIPYKTVDCTDTDIVAQLADAKGLLWHWMHTRPVDLMLAKTVIAAAESMGIEVFPNLHTCWHYDDKIAQKYLLEAVGAPVAASHVFYTKDAARAWLADAEYPLVFKLSRGAGSQNVRLVRNRAEGEKLCNQAFGRGFKPVAGYLADLGRKIRQTKAQGTMWTKLKRMPSSVAAIVRNNRDMQRERGYIYFQEFLPGNTFDTRVTVIGGRAFGFRRGVRPGDFRASGSGDIDHNPDSIDPACVSAAFDVTDSIHAQCMTYDFVYDAQRNPRIVEISYAFAAWAVHDCPGHWDRRMRWTDGHRWPQDLMIEDLLSKIRAK